MDCSDSDSDKNNNIPKSENDHILSEFNVDFHRSKAELLLRFLKDQEDLNKKFSEYDLLDDEEEEDDVEDHGEIERKYSQTLDLYKVRPQSGVARNDNGDAEHNMPVPPSNNISDSLTVNRAGETELPEDRLVSRRSPVQTLHQGMKLRELSHHNQHQAVPRKKKVKKLLLKRDIRPQTSMGRRVSVQKQPGDRLLTAPGTPDTHNLVPPSARALFHHPEDRLLSANLQHHNHQDSSRPRPPKTPLTSWQERSETSLSTVRTARQSNADLAQQIRDIRQQQLSLQQDPALLSFMKRSGTSRENSSNSSSGAALPSCYTSHAPSNSSATAHREGGKRQYGLDRATFVGNDSIDVVEHYVDTSRKGMKVRLSMGKTCDDQNGLSHTRSSRAPVALLKLPPLSSDVMSNKPTVTNASSGALPSESLVGYTL